MRWGARAAVVGVALGGLACVLLAERPAEAGASLIPPRLLYDFPQ